MSNEFAQGFLVILCSAVSDTGKTSRRSTATSVQNHQKHCSAQGNQTNIRLISLRKPWFFSDPSRAWSGVGARGPGPALLGTLFCARFRHPQNRLISFDRLSAQSIGWDHLNACASASRTCESFIRFAC